MKAAELITKKIRELNDDMVDAARNVSLDVDDDTLLADLARWAARRCGEDEEEVLREVKAWAETWGDNDSLFATLRCILELGDECNKERDNPPPPWKFREFLGFRGMEERNEWYKKRVHITIHRGTGQIGGSVTEINMGETNILVDFGSSLPGSQAAISDDELIKKIFHRRYHPIDAVFFTHYHGDHTGLIDKIPKEIPIYMDETMLEILRVLHRHTGNTAMQDLLANRDGRIHDLKSGQTIALKDMSITPFFVDHSAYHANMFLFEGAGHTILHSGDFRSTGYTGRSVEIVPRLIREKISQVDVLICEGTMMTRSVKEEHLLTERKLQEEVSAYMQDHRQLFVICSSTNFDSLSSICQAARANQLSIYANDYMVDMLKTFRKIAGRYKKEYRLPFVHTIGELKEQCPKECVVLLGSLLNKKIEDAYTLYERYGSYMSEFNPCLLYSMWRGYLNPDHAAYNEGLATFVKRFGGQVNYAHSTGHADKKTLAKFIEDIAPRKYIVPLHTENPAGFKDMEIEDKYKAIVILPKDGWTIEVK